MVILMVVLLEKAGGDGECLLCYWLLLCLEEAGGGECWRNCCSIGWRLVWTQDTTQWKSGQYLIHGSVKREERGCTNSA